MMSGNPLPPAIEIGLAATFILHIYKAVTNWAANRRARPVGYYQPVKRFFGWGWGGRPSRKTLASTTMIISGFILLAFLFLHVYQFRIAPKPMVEVAGQEMHDLYQVEVEAFSNIFTVIFYELAVIVVGSHLWHGFASAFNSLGADHPRYTPWILRAGKIFAVVIAGAFLTIPPYIYIFAAGGGGGR